MARLPRSLSPHRPASYLVSNRLGGADPRALAQRWARRLFDRQLHLCAKSYTIEVLKWRVLDDGYRMTLQVNSARQLTDREVDRRIARIGRQKVRPLSAEERQAGRERLEDLSAFMRDLQSGWTRAYNSQTQRWGPMWAGRFRSVELKGDTALQAGELYVTRRPPAPPAVAADCKNPLPDLPPWQIEEVQALAHLWPRRQWRKLVPVWEWGRAVGDREFVQQRADLDRPYCRWEVAPLGIRNLWSLRHPTRTRTPGPPAVASPPRRFEGASTRPPGRASPQLADAEPRAG